jgi:hypothetical protein
MSATYDAAMYDDFDYDACLVIHDPIAFRDRLLWVVHNALGAQGHAFAPAHYVDPLTQIEDDVLLPLQKHARYSYQDEVRAAWVPRQRHVPLSVEFVEIGNLEAIAELIVPVSSENTESSVARD